MPGGSDYIVVATMQWGVRRCGNDVVGRSGSQSVISVQAWLVRRSVLTEHITSVHAPQGQQASAG